ncbi:MAG: hypothetical protein R3A45_03340 [Bdellovibrionota bacterium]
MQQLEKEMIHKREWISLKILPDVLEQKSTKARQAQNKLKSAVHFENEMEKLKQEMPLEAKRRSIHLELKQTTNSKYVFKLKMVFSGIKKENPLFAIKKFILNRVRPLA